MITFFERRKSLIITSARRATLAEFVAVETSSSCNNGVWLQEFNIFVCFVVCEWFVVVTVVS
jgi:hypothetical protein